jgi:hypothetical protein
MLLYLSAKFLKVHADQLSSPLSTTGDGEEKLEELTKALQILQNGNNLAMTYLELLESSCFEQLCNLSPVQSFILTGDLPGHSV